MRNRILKSHWVLWSCYAAFVFASQASAGVTEVGIAGSFSRTKYSGASYSWIRKFSASVGYFFTETSEISLGFQDAIHRTFVEFAEDTTFHDQVYSLAWVQSLLPKKETVQPYFKLGVGQLNRKVTGYYAGYVLIPTRIYSLTAIMGAGLKVMMSQHAGVKIEANSYLTGGALGTWKDNYTLEAGLSFIF